MNTDTRISFGRKVAIVLVTATMGAAPAMAFATNAMPGNQAGEDQEKVEQVTTEEHLDECEGGAYCMSNEDYVKSLLGLSDEERAELVALYDKCSTLGEDEDLSDEEWDRMYELDQKAHMAQLKQTLTPEEYAEYEQLYQKDEAVRQKVEEIYRNEGLTDQEYERMFELEDICFGYTSGDA